VRCLLAGLSDQLASELRCGRRQVEQAVSPAETMRMLHRSPAPRLLVVSELFPGAGDVLAAVEADGRLANLTLVVVVGGRTALAVALGRRGVPVLSPSGVGPRLVNLLRRWETRPGRARGPATP